MEIYVAKSSMISIFFCFPGFISRLFVMYVTFTRIVAANTATDDVTNKVTRRPTVDLGWHVDYIH